MVNKKSQILVLSVFLAILITSFASAQITIGEQPDETYNLGDELSVSAEIEVSGESKTGTLGADLICNEGQNPLMRSFGYEVSDETKTEQVEATLSKGFVGENIGDCTVEFSFADLNSQETEEFLISDQMEIQTNLEKSSYKPNETATFEGTVTKENGEDSEGTISMNISGDQYDNIIKKESSLENGKFSFESNFDEQMPAGQYRASFQANESGNTGKVSKTFSIEQVPRNLEITLTKEEFPAGNETEASTILHDQTGKSISGTSQVTILNGIGETISEEEIENGESLSINTTSNEPIANWTIQAESQNKSSERTFSITENKEISTLISGSRLNITNVGNVPYNETVQVQIGNETISVNASLPVGGSESYRLTAPDGEYEVTVYEDGQPETTTRTTLTGSSIGAKKGNASTGLMSILAWVFVVLILGFVSYVFFQKTRNKTFFTRSPTVTNKNMPKKSQKQTQQTNQLQKTEKSKHGLNSKNKAEVSLSISGDKQKTTSVCIHLKNLHEMEDSKGYAEQTLQKIVDYAEKHHAYTYEDNENLYFLLAPSKTKTFKNESIALNIAVTAKRTIQKHNKLFKKPIEYGISINSGEAIFKQEGQGAKFMSVSKLVPNSKKLAAQSKNASATVLASKEVADKLKSRIQSEKFNNQEEVYKITGIKKYNDEDTKNFIKNFQERMKKEQEEHKKNTGTKKHKHSSKNQNSGKVPENKNSSKKKDSQ